MHRPIPTISATNINFSFSPEFVIETPTVQGPIPNTQDHINSQGIPYMTFVPHNTSYHFQQSGQGCQIQLIVLVFRSRMENLAHSSSSQIQLTVPVVRSRMQYVASSSSSQAKDAGSSSQFQQSGQGCQIQLTVLVIRSSSEFQQPGQGCQIQLRVLVVRPRVQDLAHCLVIGPRMQLTA